MLPLVTLCGLLAAADPAADLAARIDHHVSLRWELVDARPAPMADDAEFVRRLTLDLAGHIPAAADVWAFLDDATADKRRRLIDRLLDRAAFARHWSAVLAADWVPQASEPVAESFRAWIEERLRAHAPYDKMVRELLTAPVRPQPGQPASAAARGYLVANDFKPENLAANSARQFVGLNLECAQCHNHPFARWTQQQFWQFAAFYADVQGAGSEDAARIAIPGIEKIALARFPGGQEPPWQPGDDARGKLVDWMTAEGNPYFARNAVNRLWAYFLGTGLVEPLDDLSGAIEPSHPELLDELARAFAASGYDLPLLIRAITASRTYQLTSAIAGSRADDPRWFARMPVRVLSAEQLLDSFLLATGVAEPSEVDRRDFLSRFRRNERRPAPDSSVLEALLRMNGRLTDEATSAAGATLRAAGEAPFLDSAKRIELLYLAALSRSPSAEEARLMGKHLAASGDNQDQLADVLWVLINSAEFALNH